MDIEQSYQAFTVCWRFFKNWTQKIPLTDEQWSEIVQEAHVISEQYGATQFTELLVRASVVGIDEEEKKITGRRI